MSATVKHMGEQLKLWPLIRHYRLMARVDPRSAAFWRLRLRTAIAAYRSQRAEQQRKAA